MLTAFQHFLFVCLSILFSPPDLVRAFSAEGSRPSHRAAACLPSPSAIPSASMGQSLSVLQGHIKGPAPGSRSAGMSHRER